MSRRDQVSAGLLAYRHSHGLEVLLAHPGGPYWSGRDAGAWTIPKGLVEGDGGLLDAAIREFQEETGLKIGLGPASRFVPLKPVRQKSGKMVHAFAVEADFDLANFSSNSFEMEWPPRSGQRRSFPEVDQVGWFKLPPARQKIIAYQRPFLEELSSMVSPAPPGA